MMLTDAEQQLFNCRRLILEAARESIGSFTAETAEVWEAFVVPGVTGRDVAAACGVAQSTFVSRFLRAGLPSPKEYLVRIGFVHAAWLYDLPGVSSAAVACALKFASPQSWGRHVRKYLGITPSEYREREPFNGVLTRFREQMLDLYAAHWREFYPLTGHVGRSIRALREAQARFLAATERTAA